jgi:hypothetical protein
VPAYQRQTEKTSLQEDNLNSSVHDMRTIAGYCCLGNPVLIGGGASASHLSHRKLLTHMVYTDAHADAKCTE